MNPNEIKILNQDLTWKLLKVTVPILPLWSHRRRKTNLRNTSTFYKCNSCCLKTQRHQLQRLQLSTRFLTRLQRVPVHWLRRLARASRPVRALIFKKPQNSIRFRVSYWPIVSIQSPQFNCKIRTITFKLSSAFYFWPTVSSVNFIFCSAEKKFRVFLFLSNEEMQY